MSALAARRLSTMLCRSFTDTPQLMLRSSRHLRLEPLGEGRSFLREYHSTPPTHNTFLLAAGAGVAVAAVVARFALGAFDTRQKVDSLINPDEGATAAEKAKPSNPAGPAKPAGVAGTGGFWSAQGMARRFYRGGFEDTMTRREAALILGVR